MGDKPTGKEKARKQPGPQSKKQGVRIPPLRDADYHALFRAVVLCEDVWGKRVSSEAEESGHV